MMEIYKSMNHLNPEYIWDFFIKKDVSFNLRTKELCKLPSASSQRYGINSLSFRGSLLWNALSDDLKLTTSLVKLQKKYVAGMATTARATSALNLGFYTFCYILYCNP